MMTKAEQNRFEELTKDMEHWKQNAQTLACAFEDVTSALGLDSFAPASSIKDAIKSLRKRAEPQDLNEAILRTVQQSLLVRVEKVLEASWNTPVNKIIEHAVLRQQAALEDRANKMLACALEEPLDDALASAFRRKVAKLLVSKMEGSLQKSVNDLMQNPTTRARVLLALEGIVHEQPNRPALPLIGSIKD